MNHLNSFIIKYFLFFLISVGIFSCKVEKTSAPGEVQISGKINNGKPATIYLEELTTTAVFVVDSTKLDEEGTFLLNKKIKEPGFYRLRITPNDYITLILDSSSNIHVTADAKNMSGTYTVSGSPSSELLRDFNLRIKKSFGQIDSLQSIYDAVQAKNALRSDSLSKIIEPAYNRITSDREAYIKNFLDQHSNSMVALAAINYLNPDIDFSYFQKVDNSLTRIFPKSSYTIDFNKRFETLRKLAIGSPAPDIMLSNPEGEQVSLSSLKGKYVLIDFWASWCSPCRKESPNLVAIYKKYHSKGFEIYGISLDKEQAAWTQAIKEDKLSWTQVSDLKYWDSYGAKLYNVQSIPFTYLLDKEGTIIGKALYGKELDDKLFEMLK